MFPMIIAAASLDCYANVLFAGDSRDCGPAGKLESEPDLAILAASILPLRLIKLLARAFAAAEGGLRV